MSKKLYLGLRPKKGTVHYPVIRTQFCGDLEPALAKWPLFTHIIFTSISAVEYWPGPWDKKLIAIGKSTAAALSKKGYDSIVSPVATQEGVIDLVESIPGYFLLPRSRLARAVLTDFMEKKGILFSVIDLYDTHYQRLEPVPNLDDFDEIIFTSPSTVEGFLRIYKALPLNKKLTAIGPITEEKIASIKN